MQPPLRDYIGAEGRQVSTNSVEAFFQLPPPLPPSKRLETTRYLQEGRLKSSGKLPSNITAPMQTSSADVNSDKPKFKIDRAVWHIMDNMGIPMLWGNEDIDLDPSISRPYIMPPPNELAEQKSGRFDWIRRNRIKEERKTDSGTAPAPASGVTSATPFGTKASSGSMPQWTDPNMRKIPESELEGIKLPAPGSMDDDKKNP